jgi:PiT family inorganic phosphate transporter
MSSELLLVIITIIIALIFDFGNGLNDAANSIATVVATRVLSLRKAVILAAIGNFMGVFIFSVAVATTIGKGLINPDVVNVYIILSGLIGAIAWVYITTFFGLPISASHSLIGGFIGAAITSAGFDAVILPGIIKILIFIAVAPILGMLGGFLFNVIILWVFHKSSPGKINHYFKRLQLLSAFSYSLSHGSNDAQKTIGIIAILLFSAGLLGSNFYVPLWVILLSYSVISAGTLIGGWKVIKTVGLKITKLRAVQGFCAETAGSLVIIGCSLAGIPVSTTHVIAGSIMGVGSTRRLSAVRWKTARTIVYAWIVTIPIAMLIGGLFYYITSLFI